MSKYLVDIVGIIIGGGGFILGVGSVGVEGVIVLYDEGVERK